MKSLDGIFKVRFNDYTSYNPDFCRNGGCYGFWTNFTWIEDGLFAVSYGTTADFEFCRVCGTFGNHTEWDDERREYYYSCGEYEVVTEEQLLKLINEFKETDQEYIEYF